MRLRRVPLNPPHYARLLDTGGAGRPAVVVLASALVRAASYRPTLRALGRRSRACSVALPGSGRASPVDHPWEIADYARAAARVLEHIGAGPVVLIGHSNSGPVAVQVAARWPHLVSHLVLVGSTGFDVARPLWRIVLGRGLDTLLEPLLSAAGHHHVLHNVLVHPRNFWHQVALSASTDVRDEARRVAAPTLLAWGALDLTMRRRSARAALAVMPHARLYLSPTGSHDWLITRPAEFARVVTDFVAAR